MSTVRTRFAPSPTGYLHIGGARTALFNWLFSRHEGGKFILRIEDTDTARSTDESTKAILEGMSWLGLDCDEGPFFQSKAFDAHREAAKKLLDKGAAYRCYCLPEELEARREAAMKEGRPPKYDGRCRALVSAPTGDKPFAVRFKTPPGSTIVKDVIKGTIAFSNDEVEDLIILRSDNTPTYNLSVVVDDAMMEITHVIRGDDHINNTPKQILLYEALGYPVPIFAHLPMILGSDKTRLSKRHGATSVIAYRGMGYLPHALLNYLARLGWSHGDEEVFSREELIEKFSLAAVGKSSGVFNPEKLKWLNHHYIKTTVSEELKEPLLPLLKNLGIDASGDPRLSLIISTLKERAGTLVEMAEQSVFYFKDDFAYDPKASAKFLTPDKKPLLEEIAATLEKTDEFSAKSVEAAFNSVMESRGVKLSALAQPVRVALTGSTVSPGIFETIEALGKESTVARLKKCAATIQG